MRSQRDHSKVLIVDVKPDTTMMVGAKFHEDKANNVRSGEYSGIRSCGAKKA